jgi:hypothetical protein
VTSKSPREEAFFEAPALEAIAQGRKLRLKLRAAIESSITRGAERAVPEMHAILHGAALRIAWRLWPMLRFCQYKRKLSISGKARPRESGVDSGFSPENATMQK